MKRQTQVLLLSFLYILLPSSISGQHQKFLDSLENLTSFERQRAVFGYSEAASDLLNRKGQRTIFLEQVRTFANRKNDKPLLEQLQFIKRKQSEVMDFPRAEREKKCKENIEKYKDSNDLLFLAFCHHELGQILFQNQNYAQAFDNDLKALEIYNTLGYENVPNIGKVLHEVALHYYFFRDYEEVIKLMNISLKFPPFEKGLDIQRYNNLGMSYLHLKNYDKAEFFLNKAMDAASRYNNKIWKGILNGNIGEMYYNKKQYNASLVNFQKNYDFNKNESQHSTVKMNSSINMAKVYLALGKVTEAYQFLKMAEETLHVLESDASYVGSKYVGDRQQIENSKKLYFEAKIDFLKKTNNFREGIHYQDSLMAIRKEIEEKYNSTIGKMASDRLTIQNKELQLAVKEQEKANQRFFYSGMLLAVLIPGGLGYFYLYKSRQRKSRQNERLITTTRISVLEKQQAQKELETAQKEINHFIHRVSEQNKMVSNFERELKKLQGLKNEEQNQIRTTLSKMKKMKILTNEDWIDFQHHFDTVFPDFKNSLKEHFPTVTTSEMRYLMLVKLNFSHKEMANALGVSDTAIRVTWSRVRKKLNGTLEDTPTDLVDRLLTRESAMQTEVVAI